MTMSDRIAVMNKGRYEQLGDPETLYERPKTRFVAGFLGVSNLLHGTVEGGDADQAVVLLADEVRIRVPRGSVDGAAAIDIGVRPEKIRMYERTEEPPAGHNRLPATVRHASYLGVSTQYIVETGHGASVVVYEQNVERATKAELWEAGEEVTLAWSPEHSFAVAPVEGSDNDTDTEAGEAST